MADMSFREFVAHMEAVEQAAANQLSSWTQDEWDSAVSVIESTLLGSPHFVVDEPDADELAGAGSTL